MDVLVLDPDAPTYSAGIAAALPDVRVHTDAGAAAAAEAVVALAQAIDAAVLTALPRLRFIQALTTGTDPLDALPLPPGVAIASARGLHGPQMAEMAFLHMLALARDFPAMRANQAQHRWVRWPQPLLLGKTVVLLGLGAIAEALAARCQAFGMCVVGVSDGRREAAGCDAVLPRAALTEAAAMADFLIVLVPLTPATERLVDARVLAAMKPGGVLLNLARGRVVDEAALIAGLGAGRPAAAGLDVFETEPLPVSSPLWDMPNVVITPHVGGMSDCYAAQALPLVIDNLRRWQQSGPAGLRNLVRVTT
jgi:D-2-hydroxyacid dehydrogenase (NADP+)